MKPSIREKLERLSHRLAELDRELASGGLGGDAGAFRALGRERAEIEPAVDLYHEYLAAERERAAARDMLADPELRELAQDEMALCARRIEDAEEALMVALLPRDPDDEGNLLLEVRAGTGGDEAALFAADVLRMYMRYAETRRWKVELLSATESDLGGYKEVVARIAGAGAYARLKFESGAHRVQRVPTTETQGRIHTSACTVAVLPEAGELERVDINPADVRVDTFRASGAGGQHVNKTDSAVRLTHVPTGIVVECQNDRSQHRNKAQAMTILSARLYDEQQRARDSAEAATRKSLVGSGDRSERIRTYNFPQGRVTDHRINLTLYKLDAILDGALDELLDALVHEHQADLLAELADS